jgi:hypothetical protein
MSIPGLETGYPYKFSDSRQSVDKLYTPISAKRLTTQRLKLIGSSII